MPIKIIVCEECNERFEYEKAPGRGLTRRFCAPCTTQRARAKSLDWKERVRGQKTVIGRHGTCQWCASAFALGEHRARLRRYCSEECRKKKDQADLKRWRRNKQEREWAERLAQKPWLDRSLSLAEKRKLRRQLDPIVRLRNRLYFERRKRSLAYRLKRGAVRAEEKGFPRGIGYTAAQLRQHLERQFTKGMTWELVASAAIHIDHILPLKLFDLTDPEEVKAAFALPNLRPLWAEDNHKKHARREHLL